jgi:putative SOS response-associated peptidase YedK
MCGRFTLTAPQKLSSRYPRFRFPAATPRFNVAPTQAVLAVRNTGEDAAEFLAWGLQGNVNARSETVAVKPMFRDSLRERRAIVFADGYYEWQRRYDGKQPYYIHRPDGAPFVFAAIWDASGCALMTAAAAGELAVIHDRMPVILADELCERWLQREPMDPESAERLLAHGTNALVAEPVSTAVNRVANDAPSLIVPVKPYEQGDLFA